MYFNRLIFCFLTAVATMMAPSILFADQFCDTEIESVSNNMVGENLDITVRVWNDDCNVDAPATWGSTFIEWRLVSDDFSFPFNNCLNHDPNHEGFYNATETYNFDAGLNQRGVYQVRARSYSNDDCTGTRGQQDSQFFNVSDPDLLTATFIAGVTFFDQNPASVDVTISCNTGLPLTQTATIDRSNSVTFVVGDFISGELDCTIIGNETPGYELSHADGADDDPGSCLFQSVNQGDPFFCLLINRLEPTTVTVSKEWVSNGGDHAIDQHAEATLSCQNIRTSEFGALTSATWNLFFDGDDTESVIVYPSYLGNSACQVQEVSTSSSAVEPDDSDCQALHPDLGVDSVSCTIINTVFFEGIPALSHYGLALMALLMLGMGWIGFRRYS